MADDPNEADAAALADKDAPEQEEAEPTPEVKIRRQVAMDLGWKPKDQWVEGKKPWQDENDFLKGFAETNDRLRSEMRDLSHSTTRIIAEQRRLAERDKAQAVSAAKRAVQQAAIDGDQQAIDEATEALAQAQAAPAAAPGSDPAVNAFVERNASWFGSNRAATLLAKTTAEAMAEDGLTYAQQVAEAERAVRKAYPELFDEPAPKPAAERRPPPAVNGNSQRSAGAPAKPNIPAHVMKTFSAVAKADPRITIEAQSQIWLEEQSARQRERA